MGRYLKMMDYATKHGLSLSTIRRRIKTNQLAFKLENGRYYIAEESSAEAHDENRPSPMVAKSSPIMSLNDEILKLKNEIVDLKTLIAVLEDEIRRIKSHLSSQTLEGKSEKISEKTFATGNSDLKSI